MPNPTMGLVVVLGFVAFLLLIASIVIEGAG